MDTTFASGTVVTSAWLNQVNTKTYTTEVNPSAYGAVADGVTDDRAAILAALTALLAKGGGLVRLQSNKTYRLSAAIPLGDYPNCGIIGDGTPILYAPAASFTNTSLSTKYTSTSAVINITGQTVSPFTPARNNTVAGIKIRSEVSDGRMVDPITAQNVENLIVCSNEMYGFPVAVGVRASTVRGRSLIAFNYIHDFTTATAWATQPQISGIELDGDRVNSTASLGVWVTHNRVIDLTLTGAAFTTYGMQSDGINLQGTHPNPTSQCIIGWNIINNVGEGIDTFGHRCEFPGNIIRGCYDYGMKFIHGASFNNVTGGEITESGRSAIGVFGSSISGVGDTDRNSFSNIVISGINPNNVAFSNPACFTIDDIGATFKVTQTRVNGGSWSMGTYGQYGLCDVSQASGGGNIFSDVAMFSGAATVDFIRSDNGTSVVRLAGSDVYRTADDPTTLASGGSITPIADVHFVSGTSVISTIDVPVRLRQGGTITFIPTAIWTTNTSGNIALGSTAVVGRALRFTYSPSTSKWYPSY